MRQNTKLMFAKSLMNLLYRKPLSRITVTDITANCGLNRMTFYYHFNDLYDLLSFAFDYSTNKALEKVDNTDIREILYSVLNGLEKEKVMIFNIYSSLGYEFLLVYFYRVVDRIIRDILKKKNEGYSLSPSDEDLIVNFYNYAISGIIIDWVKHGMSQDKEALIKKLNWVIEGTMKVAIKNLSEKK